MNSSKPLAYNSPKALAVWVNQATEKIPDPAQQDLLRQIGYQLIKQEKWRGNISEYWIRRFPNLRKYLQDLYL